MIYDVIIVGAGASGMAAAIYALQQGKRVLLLEGADRIGRKILATGNGRCNFTHADLTGDAYHTDSPQMLDALLQEFGWKESLSFFAEIGLLSCEKRGGYYYPETGNASTVLDVLKYRLEELQCHILTNHEVLSVQNKDLFDVIGNIHILDKKGRKTVELQPFSYSAKTVILACGSRAGGFCKSVDSAYPYKLGTDFQLKLSPLFPSLTRLLCKGSCFQNLSGVRAECEILLEGIGDKRLFPAGEVQFTANGISGIPVFQISGLIAEALQSKKTVTLYLNFLFQQEEQYWRDECSRRSNMMSGRSCLAFFAGLLPQKILLDCLQRAGVTPEMPAKAAGAKRLWEVFRHAMHFEIEPLETDSMDAAQVCRGGFYLSQFTERLESKNIPGLFVCGEILNVDGLCGGYNLQFAWTSGIIAAKGAVLCLE